MPSNAGCWYVYILECKNKSLYTGITDNLPRRLDAHKRGKGSRYTKSFGAHRIVFSEQHPNKSSALKREVYIKHLSRKEKLGLIAHC